MPRHKGTKDVSPGKNPNICLGCSHDCIYCYAKDMALKRGSEKGGIDHVDEWKNMKIRKKDVDHRYRKKWSYAPLFPSSHDITPEILDDFLTALGNFLEPGNKVNITSKPHLECIKAICERYGDCADRIQFMFTFTAMDDKILSFWEPNTPSYKERMDCLKYVYDLGFNTRVFIEPILDPDNLEDLVKEILPFITIDIWVGKMNHFNRIKKMYPDSEEIHKALDSLEAKYTDERIIQLYETFKDNPLIKWKTGTLPEKVMSTMPKKDTKEVKKITQYQLHPVASAFPEMPNSAFQGLKRSIKENGLRHPIVLMDGRIIDGKNRYLACVELGIEPRTVEWNGKGSYVDFVIDMNSNRRDLTKSQKAMIALELKKEYAEEAKERQKKHGGTAPGRKKNTSDKSVTSVKGSARSLAANKLGVSEGYIQQAETLCKEDEDLADFVKAGSMTLPQAMKEVEKRCPPKGIGEDVGRVFIELGLSENMYLSSVRLSEDSSQRHEFSAKIKFRNAETANIEALVKTVKMLYQVQVKSMTFRPITDLERRLTDELPPKIPGDQPRKIRKIQGTNNIMVIAPHGVLNDDKHTNIIVEEMATSLGCHAIINDVFPRSEIDFNRLDTLSDEMKTAFIYDHKIGLDFVSFQVAAA